MYYQKISFDSSSIIRYLKTFVFGLTPVLVVLVTYTFTPTFFGTWVVHGKGIINARQQQLWNG